MCAKCLHTPVPGSLGKALLDDNISYKMRSEDRGWEPRPFNEHLLYAGALPLICLAVLQEEIIIFILFILKKAFINLAASGAVCGMCDPCCCAWALSPTSCGILVPRSGIEPASTALEGGFLTIGPPGKSPSPFYRWGDEAWRGKSWRRRLVSVGTGARSRGVWLECPRSHPGNQPCVNVT